MEVHSTHAKNTPDPFPLLSSLAPKDVATEESRNLLTAYSEPQRHHHTLEHVQSMLFSLQHAQSHLTEEERTIIQLAIWFHDYVYDPLAKEYGLNEKQSIERWVKFAAKMNSPKPEIEQKVSTLIEASIFHELPSQDDKLAALFLDLDLAILASDTETYNRYSENIVKEYANFNPEKYREGRIHVLEHFLGRERIFMSAALRDKEADARRNLTEEIERLRLITPEAV